MAKLAWFLCLAVFSCSGVLGIYNGITEWSDAHTLLQKSVTGGVLLYGVFGLLTTFGLIRRRKWSVVTAIVWGVIVTYVPGVATIVYGEEGASLGSAIAASLGAGLVASIVVWTTRNLVK
jgi:uncharacterized membrane protein (DUF2068 family)